MASSKEAPQRLHRMVEFIRLENRGSLTIAAHRLLDGRYLIYWMSDHSESNVEAKTTFQPDAYPAIAKLHLPGGPGLMDFPAQAARGAVP
jgi:hypothetical protein